jgi:hypothetical protein
MIFNQQSSNCHQQGYRAPIWFSLVATITFSDCALCNDDPTQPTTVHFSSSEVTLTASLFEPTGKSPYPGVVLIGGSGSAARDQLRVYAEHLCSLGFVALTYDKRGSGESRGDWTEASLG